MSSNQIYYFHTKPTNKGHQEDRGTLACRIDNDHIVYGISVCTKEDNFSKAKGREIAEKRMKQGYGQMPIDGFYKDFNDPHKAVIEFGKRLVTAICKKPAKYKRKVGTKKKALIG